jgi:uracil-DNA glycosylase family 4
MAPSGKPTHGVILVGEALGEEEARRGEPFIGPAGKQLDRMISRLVDSATGLTFSRSDFYVTNVIHCRPPNNVLTGAPYERDAIQHCSPHLVADLVAAGKAESRVILALGNQALRRLTGEWGIDKLRGYYFDTQYGLVIGSYHPSYIMRGKFELARVFQMDLLKAVEASRGNRYTRNRSYTLHPRADEVAKLVEDLSPDVPIAFDIETPYGDTDAKDDDFVAVEDLPSYTILRISFAWEEGKAVTMPWREPFVSLARKILATPNPKVTWNGTGFDIPRLVANSCSINGPHYDAMLMWHALEPSLPMGLKYVATFYCPDMPPWKLRASSEPEWYSAADSDVTICCFNGIRDALLAQGRFDMFREHFVQVDEVLRAMSNRGLLVDRGRRASNKEKFERKLETTVERAQPYMPLDIRPYKAYTYDEDRLKRQGLWEEGKMIVVKEGAEAKKGYEVVDGWMRKKPKPPKKKREKKNAENATRRRARGEDPVPS